MWFAGILSYSVGFFIFLLFILMCRSNFNLLCCSNYFSFGHWRLLCWFLYPFARSHHCMCVYVFSPFPFSLPSFPSSLSLPSFHPSFLLSFLLSFLPPSFLPSSLPPIILSFFLEKEKKKKKNFSQVLRVACRLQVRDKSAPWSI